tara:strand:+ start:4172 stop:4456 length:285 start_codon:yes stop_codon:yes gene_type:complete
VFKVVYSKKYYYQAIELSAQINQHLLDTCEIEEADDQFFDYHKNQMVDANERFNLYLNDEIFLASKYYGAKYGLELITFKDVEEKVDWQDPYSG